MHTVYWLKGNQDLAVQIAYLMKEAFVNQRDSDYLYSLAISGMMASKVSPIIAIGDEPEDVYDRGYCLAHLNIEGKVFRGENTLYLVRGLPGTGKTTFTNLLSSKKRPAIASDDYPGLYKDGIYQLDKAKEAHLWCQQKCEFAIEKGHQPIIHNTFTQDWEIHPYLAIASQYNYSVTFVHCQLVDLPDGHSTVSTHGVPLEIVEKMRSRFQPLSVLLPWINSGYPKPEYVKKTDT